MRPEYADVLRRQELRDEQSRVIEKQRAEREMKPLADVGIARARVRESERIVPEQSNVVQSLNVDLQVAEQVQAFAQAARRRMHHRD